MLMLNNYDIKLRIFRRNPRIRFQFSTKFLAFQGLKCRFVCVCADFLVRWHFSFFQLCFSRVQVSVFTYVFPRKSGEPTWPGKLVEGLYIWYTYIRMCTEHTLLSIHICVQIIVCISYYDMRTSICTHVEHKIYTIYIHIYIHLQNM